jgi:predicted transcriptional regulator
MNVVEDDDLDPEERARLHEALDAGIAAARSGDHVDAEEVVRELLARS